MTQNGQHLKPGNVVLAITRVAAPRRATSHRAHAHHLRLRCRGSRRRAAPSCPNPDPNPDRNPSAAFHSTSGLIILACCSRKVALREAAKSSERSALKQGSHALRSGHCPIDTVVATPPPLEPLAAAGYAKSPTAAGVVSSAPPAPPAPPPAPALPPANHSAAARHTARTSDDCTRHRGHPRTQIWSEERMRRWY